MQGKNCLLLLFVGLILGSCSVSRYQPSKKYSPQQLAEDYAVFRGSLEEAHPSLYWYTPKDSMDFYFEVGKSKLKDSLTEGQFRTVLSYVISKVRCGHTTVRPSRAAAEATSQNSPFPLYIKTWPDTTVVMANVNRKDSSIHRGVILQKIDNRPIAAVLDSLFSYLSTDGYNQTHKYQTLSNGNAFRNLYASAFGLKTSTPVEYIDTLGQLRTANLALYNVRADSARRTRTEEKGPSRRERKRLEREAMRSLRFDSALHLAIMEVNTFTKGYNLRRFFRQSFKEIEKRGVPNLVVDMRVNGGGSVVLSNLLTKYIIDQPFQIADTLYAVRRGSEYGKYRSSRFFNWLFLQFFTKKRQDGRYHFWLFENKTFKPKKKYNFNGTTYILTGGNTFSAATLFTKSLQVQDDVVVVGEETGGGAYGNSAWLIPDVTLPNTKVRYRLPLFRLIIDKDADKGHGVKPNVPALPTVEALREGEDYKMEKVKNLIREKRG